MSGECEKCGEHTTDCKCNRVSKCIKRGCRNLEYRCKDCGRVVNTVTLPETDWVSVKDRLPEDGEGVLTYDTNFGQRVDYMLKVDCMEEPYVWCNRLVTDWEAVTHWQPLPKAPE